MFATRPKLAAALLVVALPLVSARRAFAFNTSYHERLIVDALKEAGLGDERSLAVKLVEVSSWYADLFAMDPHSVALDLHFDDLGSAEEVLERWGHVDSILDKRLDELLEKKDPIATLLFVGLVLHGVEDFYAHSNWADIDWKKLGYREDAIYDEVSADLLLRAKDPSGHELHTGFWSTSGRKSPDQQRHEDLNKDYEGRLHHAEAFRDAARATKRWVERIRKKLEGDPVLAFGELAKLDNERMTRIVDAALAGAEKLSKAAGAWDDSKPERDVPTTDEIKENLPRVDDLSKRWDELMRDYVLGLTARKQEEGTLELSVDGLEKAFAKIVSAAKKMLGAGFGEIGKAGGH